MKLISWAAPFWNQLISIVGLLVSYFDLFLERSGINKFNHSLRGNKELFLLAEFGFMDKLF